MSSIKAEGVWRTQIGDWIRVGGAWRPLHEKYIRAGGAYRPVMNAFYSYGTLMTEWGEIIEEQGDGWGSWGNDHIYLEGYTVSGTYISSAYLRLTGGIDVMGGLDLSELSKVHVLWENTGNDHSNNRSQLAVTSAATQYENDIWLTVEESFGLRIDTIDIPAEKPDWGATELSDMYIRVRALGFGHLWEPNGQSFLHVYNVWATK